MGIHLQNFPFFFRYGCCSGCIPRGSDISISGEYSFDGSIPGGNMPSGVSKPNT